MRSESGSMSRRTLLSAAGAAIAKPIQADDRDLRIWDLHCHLNGFDGETPTAKAAEMLRLADRMGVERMCVYMGYPFSYDPSPDDLRGQNNQVLEALRVGRGRLLGFVYVNPNHLDVSAAEIDRCVRDGPMVGVKLWVAKRAAAKELDSIVARASALKAAIFQHTWFKVGGNLPGESTPLDVAALARRHPKAQIICGHTGRGLGAGHPCRSRAAEYHTLIPLARTQHPVSSKWLSGSRRQRFIWQRCRRASARLSALQSHGC